MPTHSSPKRLFIIVRLTLALIFIVLGGAVGLWVGHLSVPNDMPEYETIVGGTGRTPKPARVTEEDLNAPLPPVYFHAGPFTPEHWPIVLEEARMAGSVGVHQVIIPASLDWASDGDAVGLVAQLADLVKASPRARIYLQLQLDPPAAWAAARPTETLKTSAKDGVMAAPYSALWREEAARRAGALAKRIASEKIGNHVRGYFLAALDGGHWEIPASVLPSTGASEAFRAWLRKRYTDNEALRKAWGNDIASLEVSGVPEIAAFPAEQVFLQLPEQQQIADYREFVSDSSADAIAEIMVAIKEATSPATQVFALYAHTYEATPGALGAHGMGRLLYSDLDGFVGPVSASDRGIGGAGGLSGPTFSATLHQKAWITLDATRTGVEQDAATGQIQRMQGIRAEDVFNVQRRNFAQAAALGNGLAWSDPLGEGWLHDEEQWTRLGQLADIYKDIYPVTPVDPNAAQAQGARAASSEKEKAPAKSGKAEPASKAVAEAPPTEATAETVAPLAEDSVNSAPPTDSFDQNLEALLSPAPVGPPNTFKGGLAVVVDEGAMHYVANDALVRDRLLLAVRDAAQRSGASVRLFLLQDLLDDIAPSAETYIFVNAFRLSDAERQRIHARLQRDRACAIWCYAPGYLSPAPDAAAVGKTVGMNVVLAKGTAQAGSSFALSGRWLAEAAEIGDTVSIAPLFSIDDPEADILARYRADQKGSIAVRVLPEGWTSIYVAEPSMTPALLRELLHIIEKRSCFRDAAREHFDAAYVGLNLVGIHARQSGEITISLGNVFDIQDVFDPSMGWPQKESITIPVKTGETRLLRLTPVY